MCGESDTFKFSALSELSLLNPALKAKKPRGKRRPEAFQETEVMCGFMETASFWQSRTCAHMNPQRLLQNVQVLHKLKSDKISA